jgi:hypothetical protein
MMGTFDATSANEQMTRHAYSSDDGWNRAVERLIESRGALHVRTERSGLPAAALMDIQDAVMNIFSRLQTPKELPSTTQ